MCFCDYRRFYRTLWISFGNLVFGASSSIISVGVFPLVLRCSNAMMDCIVWNE